jgi:hypothetical protein
MRSLILILSFLFSVLEIMTSLLVFPLTMLCSLGLIVFTHKIARDMRAQKSIIDAVYAQSDRLPA